MLKLTFLICFMASILLLFLYRADPESDTPIEAEAPTEAKAQEEGALIPSHSTSQRSTGPKQAPIRDEKVQKADKASETIEILMKEMTQLQGADYDRMESLAYQILELNPQHSYARTSLAIVIMKRDLDYNTGMNMLQEIIGSPDADDAIIQEYVTASIYAGQETKAIKFLQKYANENGVKLPEGSISLLEYSRENNDNAIEVEEGNQIEP